MDTFNNDNGHSPLGNSHLPSIQCNDVSAVVTHRFQTVVKRRFLDAVKWRTDIPGEGCLFQYPALGELRAGRDAETDGAVRGASVALYHIRVVGCNYISPLNAELNPIRHLLALVGARHFVHVSRIWVSFVNTSMINDARCTREIKSRTAMANAILKKEKDFSPAKWA